MKDLDPTIKKKDFDEKIKIINQLIHHKDIVETLRTSANFGKFLQGRFPNKDTSFILSKITGVTLPETLQTRLIEEESDLSFSKNLHESLVDLYRDYLSQNDEISEDLQIEDKFKYVLIPQMMNTLHMAKLGLESYFKVVKIQWDNPGQPDRFNEAQFLNIRETIHEQIETNSKIILKLIQSFNSFKKDLDLVKEPSMLVKQKQQSTLEMIELIQNKYKTQQEILNELSNKLLENREIFLTTMKTDYRFIPTFFKPVIKHLKKVPIINEFLKTSGELLLDKIEKLDIQKISANEAYEETFKQF